MYGCANKVSFIITTNNKVVVKAKANNLLQAINAYKAHVICVLLHQYHTCYTSNAVQLMLVEKEKKRAEKEKEAFFLSS